MNYTYLQWDVFAALLFFIFLRLPGTFNLKLGVFRLRWKHKWATTYDHAGATWHKLANFLTWSLVLKLNSMRDMASVEFKSSKCWVSVCPVEANWCSHESYIFESYYCSCCKVELCGQWIGPCFLEIGEPTMWEQTWWENTCHFSQGGNLQSSECSFQSLSGYHCEDVGDSKSYDKMHR